MPDGGSGVDGEEGLTCYGVWTGHVEEGDPVGGPGYEVGSGGGPDERGDGHVGFGFMLDEAVVG